MPDEKLTKEEIIKEQSNYLHGNIKEELKKDSVHFSPDDAKLLKFHGIYEQDNRDTRQERNEKGIEKEYGFMIRTKLPAGQLTPKQYLDLNDISDKYANGTMRITTRQTIQFHGVIKGNLQKTLNEINKNLITTYGACGDVVRNVMCCPVCDINPESPIDLTGLVKEVSKYLLPNTKAYYEIWVDGEKIETATGRNGETAKEEEPLYGKTYLPRKFKIGFALPRDNCIDVFSQDIGIIPALEKTPLLGFKHTGYNILIGGGLGFTHHKPETYPRLATELGFVKVEKLIETIEKIVTIQRDFGCRTNRRHARMKYLIDDKGLEWFKNELEKRLGFKLEAFKSPVNYAFKDHLGWHEQTDGKVFVGLYIENGRICDYERRKVKTGLKEIIKKYEPNVRLTPQQNIILSNLKKRDKDKTNELLNKYGIYTQETVQPIRRYAMACPALPTCGLALAEAERVLPSILDELINLGHSEKHVSIRISGCPNSCSRPSLAEIGIIGTSPKMYSIYIGGRFDGTALNKLYKENVSEEFLAREISALFTTYKAYAHSEEPFGEFCNRLGLDLIKSVTGVPEGTWE